MKKVCIKSLLGIAVLLSSAMAHAIVVDVTADQVEGQINNTWSVVKTAGVDALILAPGETYLANYSVTVSLDSVPTEQTVASGQIDIFNTTGTEVNVTAILSDIDDMQLVCAKALPFTLVNGETVTCTYDLTYPSADYFELNITVQVDGVDAGSGNTPVDHYGNIVIQDACVTIEDPLDVFTPRSLCKDESTMLVYNYASPVGPFSEPDQCGAQVVSNTATVTGDDTGTSTSSTWDIDVTVACETGEPITGCTLSKGYFKNHSLAGPAAYDDVWELLSLLGSSEPFNSAGTYLDVLTTPPKRGNVYYILCPQIIASELNVLNGASMPQSVSDQFDAGQAYCADYTPKEMLRMKRKDRDLRDTLIDIGDSLEAYNVGDPILDDSGERTNPPHCDEDHLSNL